MLKKGTSVVVAAKNFCERIIKDINGKNFPVAKSAVDEKNLLSARNNEIASILTAGGQFDRRTAKPLKYYDKDKKLFELQLKGSRKIPIEVRFHAKNEDITDALLEDFLRHLPTTWKIGEKEGSITIKYETNSDWDSGNYQSSSLQSVFLQFEMPVATDPIEHPTLRKSQVQGGIMNG